MSERAVAAVLADRPAVRGERAAVEMVVAQQLADHGRDAARPIEVLAEVFTGRLQVHQQRDAVTVTLPVVERDLDTCVPCDGVDMDRCIGGAAERRVHADRIDERRARQDVGGLAVGMHHLDDLPAGVARRIRGDRDTAPGSLRCRAATARAPR